MLRVVDPGAMPENKRQLKEILEPAKYKIVGVMLCRPIFQTDYVRTFLDRKQRALHDYWQVGEQPLHFFEVVERMRFQAPEIMQAIQGGNRARTPSSLFFNLTEVSVNRLLEAADSATGMVVGDRLEQWLDTYNVHADENCFMKAMAVPSAHCIFIHWCLPNICFSWPLW